MTAIVEELERKLQAMDAARAARAEKMIRELMARLDEEAKATPAPRAEAVTRTFSLGLKPGIDPTKLGQLAEEL